MRRDKARILDEYLAAAARAGDKRAFERLFKSWQPRLFGHAYRLTGDVEMARDATQDAWADIVRGLTRLGDVVAFPAWAFRIVSRRSIDQVRRIKTVRRTNSALSLEPAETTFSPDSIETNADSIPLSRAISQLPTEQRVAISLFYLEDLSVAEIAAALETPAGTIKTRLMHARKKLRASLEKH